jgi:hypothetical protein
MLCERVLDPIRRRVEFAAELVPRDVDVRFIEQQGQHHARLAPPIQGDTGALAGFRTKRERASTPSSGAEQVSLPAMTPPRGQGPGGPPVRKQGRIRAHAGGSLA